MATKEWLKSRNKITIYIKPDFYKKIQDWKEERNIKQDSQAVLSILEHYLNDQAPPEIYNQFLEERVKELEKKMEKMENLVFNVGAKMLAPKIEAAKPDFDPPTERIEIEYDESDVEKGLTKSQLCQKIGLTIHQANIAFKQQGFKSIDEYLFKITGWQAGEGKRPRYFLSDEAEETESSEVKIEPEAIEAEAIETETKSNNEVKSELVETSEGVNTELSTREIEATETERESSEIEPEDLPY